jgi:hypothetical protein
MTHRTCGFRIDSDQVAASQRQSADDEYERLHALDVQMLDDKVVVEGPLKLFRFADPDGNALELFSLHA